MNRKKLKMYFFKSERTHEFLALKICLNEGINGIQTYSVGAATRLFRHANPVVTIS
jgi:hypothetical protein